MVHVTKEDKILELPKEPSAADLRWFGLSFLAFMGLVGWGFWPRESAETASKTASFAIWGCGAVLTAVYYAVPALRKRLFLGFLTLAYPVGFVVSHVIMAVLFYLVFLPLGLVLRLTGHDPLGLREGRFGGRHAKQPDSYWCEHRTGDDPARYFRKF